MRINWDKLLSYLENNLSNKEKINFEHEIENNVELKSIIKDIHENDLIIKKLPQYKVSSNFMVQLNQKIDDYENSNLSWYNKIIDQFISSRYSPALGTICLILILTFTTGKIYNSFYDNVSDSSNFNKEELIATNDDSLSNQIDSLNYSPTLLISKDK